MFSFTRKAQEQPLRPADNASSSLYRTQPDVPPPQDPRPEEFDALFAQELNKLSIQERDDVLQDLHGVSDIIAEDENLVSRCLQEMHGAIVAINEKDAYLMAEAQNYDYVHSLDFRLMFLRAEYFNPEDAAIRLVAFFESKKDLFGVEKLTKPITLDDLGPDDIAALEAGYSQLLPGRDRAGRAIVTVIPLVRTRSSENKLRALFYISMAAVEDVETQKRGVVGLVYNVGPQSHSDRSAVWKNGRLCATLPIRWVGMHYCYDNPTMRMLLSLAMFVFGRNTRLRCRTHYGTPIECIYTLMTFGIPAEILPIESSGELRIKRHLDWLSMRRHQEKSMQNPSEEMEQGPRVVVPSTYDVLLGRGKPLQKHPGNLRYHHIIESHKEEYELAQKLEKTNIAMRIVQEIKDSGGRFLKQDPTGQWRGVDDDTARYKVSHTFRNHRIAARSQQQKAEHQKISRTNGDVSSDTEGSMSVPGKRLRVNDDSSTGMLSDGISESWAV